MTRQGKLAKIASFVATLRTDTGGAALLVVATIAALIWANLPLSLGYSDFWGTEVTIAIADAELRLDLHHLVNDGLMTFFFFVVGLEVKRELVLGELADRRRIAVPLMAAAVGIVVPAAIYLSINWGGQGQGGWGTVISTDTAFLLGVLALLGRACPPQLRVLLMAVAVADDVGALAVIAIFYTDKLQVGYLLAACAGVGLMFVLRWLNVWRGPAYMVLGIAAWIALYLSGIHATLLGVAVAFMTETYATRRDDVATAAGRTRAYLQSPTPELAHAAGLSLQRAVPVNERLLQLWQPWTTVVIVPLFALANAGIPLSMAQVKQAVGSPVTIGVILGLVVGKTVGIFAGAELTIRLGLGRLSPGLTRLHLLGGAALAGMGFTISLFIVDLAFPAEEAANAARIGILAASLLAAALGAAILRYAAHRYPTGKIPERLEPPVDVKHDHIRGPVDASLTLVEYGDYESAQSIGAHKAVQEVRRRLPDEVRFVFRHLVNDDINPHAHLAAEAAEAAGRQGRFWEMHDQLLDTSSDVTSAHLTIDDLLAKAAVVGLDQADFARDLGAGRLAHRVQQDCASAHASGATRSPTFFINGNRYVGAHNAESLLDALIAARPDTGQDDASRTTQSAPRTDLLPPWRSVPGQAAVDLDAISRDLEETPDHGGLLPRLSDRHLQVLTDAGSTERTQAGQVLFRAGENHDDLLAILSGAVAIVEYSHYDAPAISVHERGRFLGEVDLLTQQVSSRTAVVIRPGEVIRLTPQQQGAAFGRDRQLREVIVRTLLLRRAGLLANIPDLRVVGAPESDEIRTLTEWATANGQSIAVDDATEFLANTNPDDLDLQPEDFPLVFARSGELLKNPGRRQLERTLPAHRPAAPTHSPSPTTDQPGSTR